jgi:PKD repeat protein
MRRLALVGLVLAAVVLLLAGGRLVTQGMARQAAPASSVETREEYAVRGRVTNSLGYPLVWVTVSGTLLLRASFSAGPLSGPAPLDVQFSNTSYGDFAASRWDFGDGIISTQTSPTHTYAAAGSYTVTLVISGGGGAHSLTRAALINVSAPVQAEFSAAPQNGPAPLQVQFSNLSSGGHTGSLWDFGDGLTSMLEAPTHTYAAPGSYPVWLRVEGPGGSHTQVKEDYITVYDPVQAELSASPTGGAAPLAVEFTNLSRGDFTAVHWDFGDGVTSTLEAPTHTYAAPGSYTVTLEVRGPGGLHTRVKSQYIHPHTAGAAEFSAAPASGTAPLEAQFTDVSSGAYTARRWDFGDGVTSTLEAPTHTYAVPGSYTVTLAISGTQAVSTEVKTGYIRAYAASRADFSADQVSGPAPLLVRFANQSSGDYTASRWDFGDGVTSTAEAPLHTYAAPGAYTVTLDVDGPGGADRAAESAYIHVIVHNQADFSAAPRKGAPPLAVQFSSLSSGEYTASRWDFGDGVTSTLEAPLHIYTAPGSYTVTLEIQGPGGASRTVKAAYIAVTRSIFFPLWHCQECGQHARVYTATTDAGGSYTLTIPISGSYRVTPALAGQAFSPPSRTLALPLDAGGQDFTCTSCAAIDPAAVVSVTAGNFQMGCPSSFANCIDAFLPLHTVYLDTYAIDKYEVTNGRYAACVAEGVCSPPQSFTSYTRPAYYGNPEYQDYPVLWVSWFQAKAFCNWQGKRLPTEAEWEKAARGSSDTRIFPWGDGQPDCTTGNFYVNGYCVGDTAQVGSYPAGASPYGALDMAGNVNEWVNDWYESEYYGSQSTWLNPTGPLSGMGRVVRDNGWMGYWRDANVFRRALAEPAWASFTRGFRCVHSAVNLPPDIPTNPSPANGATWQLLNSQLSWSGSNDLEGDRVTYDVYFEANDTTPDVLVANHQSGLTFNPGTLSVSTSYYWQVIARDAHGASATGPVWGFTSRGPEVIDASVMVSVPAGDFQMGCSPSVNPDSDCLSGERPLHTVYLDAYDIDKYEVTNGRYAGCVDAGACSPPYDASSWTRPQYYGNQDYLDYPVIYVDWAQARAFCEWQGRRLPTEAEWEKAARGASDTRLYPWGDQYPDCTRGNILCMEDTTTVGRYPLGASPYGALDMAGNVSEWVSDWYQFDYYSSQASWSNPLGPASGTSRVARGGPWAMVTYMHRVSTREARDPVGGAESFLGFRCARTH